MSPVPHTASAGFARESVNSVDFCPFNEAPALRPTLTAVLRSSGTPRKGLAIYEDSTLQIGALIRVKHAVIAPRCVKGRGGAMNVLRNLWGCGSPKKNEPQPLEQPGSDAG
jgi:hypothetical protein